MLEILNLHASVEDSGAEILRGINLNVRPGEVHAIMGTNGSGKSTLANVLTGRDGYEVTAGNVKFCDQDLLEMEPDERARAGVFMAFQYPVELPGVNAIYFLRTALNAKRESQGLEPINIREFSELVREKASKLGLNASMLNRAVNEGFSGGEKKRNEILQMAILEPKLAILDETDSGLDIDALQIVADGVNALRKKDNAIIIITHYQRLLDYIVPDYVHVMIEGKIVRSGGKELALELESRGYSWIKSEDSVSGAAV